MKKCPFCAEEIQDEAIVCRFCGRDLDHPSNIEQSNIQSQPTPLPVNPPLTVQHKSNSGRILLGIGAVGLVIGALLP